jgi:hypothetical protein
MEQRNKVFVGKMVDAEPGKPLVAVVSTEDADGVNDIIVQGKSDKGRGWLLDDFNERGRIYWMHDPFRPNLAKARAWVDGPQLMLSVQFDLADPFAAELDRKYRDGFLDEWSVGFRPTSNDAYESNEKGGFTFYEQILDEVSAVNQGMNPNTRTVGKDYLDLAGKVHEISERIRSIEAAIMQGQKRKEDDDIAELREAMEALRRARATV